VRHVESDAEDGPQAQEALPSRCGDVETRDAHDGIVEPVQNARSGAEIVHLLRELKVSRVEYRTEDPGREAEVRENNVELAHRVLLVETTTGRVDR